jgi:hypothetical protein
MNEKPKRFQFRLRTLIAVSLGIGLIMLLNTKPTLVFEIGGHIDICATKAQWYGWPMPAYSMMTFKTEHLIANELRANTFNLGHWNDIAIWIDSITAALILYLLIRIVGRRKPATPA